MNIITGKLPAAKRIVIYGAEGIGKSTLASQCPDPLFIDTEGSTTHMDVKRFEAPTSWQMLLDQVQYVINNPAVCKTLVIDTADWAEQIEINDLCKKKGWDGLEGAGYGKGYQYSAEEFGKLLNKLTEVVKKGVNVVITAHATLRKVELPEEMGAYDHWEMKTSKKVAPMIKEWADVVLFLNYQVNVVNTDGKGAIKGKNKAQGGRRVIHTNHTPFWDAKNRFGMPEELPLDYMSIAPLFEDGGQDFRKAPEPAKPKSKPAPKPAPAPVNEPAKAPAPDPAPPEEISPDLQGFVAEEDLYLRKNGELYHIKAGNLVPGGLLDAERITRAEYDKSQPSVMAGPEDIMNVPAEYQEPDPRINKSLRDLMIANKVDEWEVQNIAAACGYVTADMRVADYPEDFVSGWAVGFWPQLLAAIKEARKTQELEYK